MARRCVLGGLVCLLFLIALFRGCGSDSPCPNEEHLIVERSRLLFSPNYPESYGDDRNCSWKITTESGNDYVSVYVFSLNLEGGQGCPSDSVSFYDSDGPELDQRLAKLCGSDPPTKIIRSTGPHMYIKFVSDHNVTKSGFELHITPVRRRDADQTVPNSSITTTAPSRCGSDCLCPNEEHLIVERSRLLFSPNYPESYGDDRNCNWKITTESADETVFVYVLRLNLEGGNGCPSDSLSFYDSDGPELDQRLAKLCGSDPRTKIIQSTGRHMYLKFLSNHNVTKSGFKLYITTIRQRGADRTVPNSSTTTTPPFRIGAKEYWVVKARPHRLTKLTTPEYHSGHRLYRNISWSILCDPGYVVQLHIVEMDLHSSSQCGENRVTVYNTDKTVLATMCNFQFEGVNMYSSGDAIYVHFTTGSSQNGKGFSLGYQAVWPYEAQPWYTKSPPWSYTTTTSSPDGGTKLSVTVIAVLAGVSFCVLICCVVVGAHCCRRRLLRPCFGRPATSTSSATRRNNDDRSVYVVPRQHTRPAIPRPSILPAAPPPGAQVHNNPAFSPHSEDPPSYSSLNITTVQVEMEGLPSYRESMIMTHPPSYKDVIEETSARR